MVILGIIKGDICESYADPTKTNEIMNWESKLDLQRMCEDSWIWQKNNPNGI